MLDALHGPCNMHKKGACLFRQGRHVMVNKAADFTAEVVMGQLEEVYCAGSIHHLSFYRRLNRSCWK